ncbi:MAG: glycogen-binding domain-containing protein [Verrucomicrobia bacterium]|nr:glycogen-binding domain-containing protein [Verrucomicrobiota bacterium]
MNKRSSTTEKRSGKSATTVQRPSPQTSRARGVGVPAAPAPMVPVATAALHPHPVRIGYFNPDAREVFVAGTFNDWDPRETPLARDSFGDWAIELSLPPGEHRYRLIVDGEWRDDPSSQRVEANPFGGYDAVIFVQ